MRWIDRIATYVVAAGLIHQWFVPHQAEPPLVRDSKPHPDALPCIVGAGLSGWVIGSCGIPDYVALGTPYRRVGDEFLPLGPCDVILEVKP